MQLRENYVPTPEALELRLNGTYYGIGQTFKASSNHDLAGFSFKVKRVGSPTAQVRAKLYETSGGLPTGDPVATSSDKAASSYSTSAGFVYVPFNVAYSLTSGVTYAIVLEYESGTQFTSSAYLSVYGAELQAYWVWDTPDHTAGHWVTTPTGGMYANGNVITKNSSAEFSAYNGGGGVSNYDLSFKNYG